MLVSLSAAPAGTPSSACTTPLPLAGCDRVDKPSIVPTTASATTARSTAAALGGAAARATRTAVARAIAGAGCVPTCGRGLTPARAHHGCARIRVFGGDQHGPVGCVCGGTADRPDTISRSAVILRLWPRALPQHRQKLAIHGEDVRHTEAVENGEVDRFRQGGPRRAPALLDGTPSFFQIGGRDAQDEDVAVREP